MSEFHSPSSGPTEITSLLTPVTGVFSQAATHTPVPLTSNPNSSDFPQIYESYGSTSSFPGNYDRIQVGSECPKAEESYSDPGSEFPCSSTGGKVAYNEFDQNSDPLQFYFLETSLDPICILSLKGRILHLSNVFSQARLSTTRHDIPDDHFASFLHPSDEASLATGLREVARTGSVVMILRLRNAQGLYEWFDFQGTLSERSNQKQVMLHGRRREVIDESLMQEFMDVQLQMQCTIPWLRLSRTGIILYASTNSCIFLDDNHSCTGSMALDDLCETPSKEKLIDILTRVAASNIAVCINHLLLLKSGAKQRVHSTIVNSAPASGTCDFLIMYIHILGNGGNGPRAKPQFAACSCGTHYLSVPDSGALTMPSSRSGNAAAGDITMRSSSVATSLNLPNCVFTSPAKPTRTREDSLQMLLSPDGGPSKPSMTQQPRQPWDLEPATASSAFFVLYELQQQNATMQAELRDLERRQKRRKKKELGRSQGIEKGGCAHCGSVDTPEWRRGPNGKYELCNKCGLKWAKDEKAKAEAKHRDENITKMQS